MTNYQKGRNFEYSVKRKLELQGYIVVRSAGSHSYFDLIAFNQNEVLCIQCKKKKSFQKDLQDLKKLKEQIDNAFIKIILATKTKTNKIHFIEV